MKRNNLLKLGVILVLFSTLMGCLRLDRSGNAAPLPSREEKIQAAMEQLLEEKYGESFTVEQPERQKANMAFVEDTFTASVRSGNYPGTFTARVDAEGKNLTDDYPRLFWDTEIEQRARQTLDSVEGLTETEWKIVYVLSGQTWKADDDLESYLQEGETYLDLTVTLPPDLEQAAAAVEDLRGALQQNHLQYAAACRFGDATVIFSEKTGQPQLTDEQIYQKLERSLP